MLYFKRENTTNTVQKQHLNSIQIHFKDKYMFILVRKSKKTQSGIVVMMSGNVWGSQYRRLGHSKMLHISLYVTIVLCYFEATSV